MTNNQLLRVSPATTESVQLRAVAECLQDYLKIHGRSGRTFEVLQFLASETLRRLNDGLDPRFNNYAIRDAVMGETERDASAWLSPIWKKITTDLRQQREEGLQQFAAERRLDCYPWVSKLESSGGGGNQALFFLVALPLPETDKQSPTTIRPLLVMTRPLEAQGTAMKLTASDLKASASSLQALSTSITRDGQNMANAIVASSNQAIKLLDDSERVLTHVRSQALPNAVAELRSTSEQLVSVSSGISMAGNLPLAMLTVGLLLAGWCFLNSISVLHLYTIQDRK